MTKPYEDVPDSEIIGPSSIGRRRALQTMIGAAGTVALSSLLPNVAHAQGNDLVIAIPNNPSTFDPINQANHDALVVTQTIFENLVVVTPDGELEPQLAQELPHISEDGLVYTFDLRDNVKFQNGKLFSAEDVKYSFDYVLNPDNNALRRPLFDRIKAVVVESPTRVRFELSEPYRPLLFYMTKYMGIFPKGSREEYDADYFRSSPIGLGTGPGVFVEWRQNDRVVLKRNPDYWRNEVPSWDRAIIRTIPDESARLAYLQTGTVDIVSAPNPRDFEQLQRESNGIITGKKLTMGGWFFLMMNNKKPPFDDVNFRRAIAQALDRDMIAEQVYYDMVEPATIPAPPGQWWFDEDANQINQFDLEAAKASLAKSKYANNASFEMLVPSHPYLLDVKDAAIVIQAQLAQIGINVNITEMEFGILLEQIRFGNHTSALQVWMSPGEPTFMIDLCYGQDNTFSKSAGYENPKAWDLIDQTYAVSDQQKLKPIFAELMSTLATDSPHVWLGFVYASNAWRQNITGFDVNQGLTMRIGNVSKS